MSAIAAGLLRFSRSGCRKSVVHPLRRAVAEPAGHRGFPRVALPALSRRSCFRFRDLGARQPFLVSSARYRCGYSLISDFSALYRAPRTHFWIFSSCTVRLDDVLQFLSVLPCVSSMILDFLGAVRASNRCFLIFSVTRSVSVVICDFFWCYGIVLHDLDFSVLTGFIRCFRFGAV
jgi:hypothetical protein